MARITTKELAEKFIEEQIALVKEQVGDKKGLLVGCCRFAHQSHRQAAYLRPR